MAINIHPSVNNGVKVGTKDFKGGALTCKCASAPVTVTLGANVAFNHACGCSKCRPQVNRNILDEDRLSYHGIVRGDHEPQLRVCHRQRAAAPEHPDLTLPTGHESPMLLGSQALIGF